MEDYALLRALVLVWMAALIFGYAMVRARLPLAVGYILSGLLIGPYGLKLITDANQIHELAEIGVALLLFALGVEVSLRTILNCPKKIIWVGICQFVFTAGIAWFLAWTTGLSADRAESFLFGCVCALSTTVVVTKLLMERGEIDALHGRLLIPVLIIQDLSLVPVISLFEAFKNPSGELLTPLLISVLKSAILVGCVFIAATRVVPKLLSEIAKVNSRELFFLTIICLCLGVSILSYYCGFSLALGAFLAGITVSESPYGHQALADLLPMRDLFAVVFFASVGLLLNPFYVASHGVELMVFVVALIVGKALIAALCAYPAVRSWWATILFGVGLAQIGEFSFVLASLGYQSGVLHEGLYNLLFAGSAISLIVSPGLISITPGILHRSFGRLGFSSNSDKSPLMREVGEPKAKHTDHIIICGFGRTGRNLGRVFEAHNLPFLVIDLNAALLEELAPRGIPAIYGDVFNERVLEEANLKEASCLIVTIPDPLAALGTISIARRVNPDLPIIARGHRTQDIDIFRAAGANAVVQPEFEASVEIARLSLLSLHRSGQEIQEALNDLRQHRYAVFKPDIPEQALAQVLGLPDDARSGAWFYVNHHGRATNRTLQELDVRRLTGVSVVAIKRDELLAYPSPSEKLLSGDEIYVVGDLQQLQSFEETFGLSKFCSFSEQTSDEISVQ